jgi:hypothetical protein
MTEAEWRACPFAWDMWGFVWARSGDRKKLLFAAACCRRVWPYLDRPESREAVEVAERLADGAAGKEDRIRARKAAKRAVEGARDDPRGRAAGAAHAALEWWDGHFDGGGVLMQVVDVAGEAAYRAACPQSPEYDPNHPAGKAGWLAEGAALAGLLRCVFGPLPFRPVTASPAWLAWQGGAVGKLARAAYDDRLLPSGELDRARLAVLADALEDAGCADAWLLGHLRDPGPHVRGCHVLDAILSKA